MQEESKSTGNSERLRLIQNEIGELENTTSECEFGLFQCTYCDDGFNDEGLYTQNILCAKYFNTLSFSLTDLILEHMSVVHPMKFGFCAKRQLNYSVNVDSPSKGVSYSLIEDLVAKSKKEKHTENQNTNIEVTSFTNEASTSNTLLILNTFSLSPEEC